MHLRCHRSIVRRRRRRRSAQCRRRAVYMLYAKLKWQNPHMEDSATYMNVYIGNFVCNILRKLRLFELDAPRRVCAKGNL